MDNVAEIMMINFSESGHPVFRGSSALERGDLKSKGKGKSSIHFHGNNKTVEVVLRTIVSVSQLSIYATVADMCEELAWKISKRSEGTERPVVPNDFRDHGCANRIADNKSNPPTDERVQGDVLRDCEQKLANLPVHL